MLFELIYHISNCCRMCSLGCRRRRECKRQQTQWRCEIQEYLEFVIRQLYVWKAVCHSWANKKMNIYRVIPSTSLSHTVQDAWVRRLISQNKAGPPENKHGPKSSGTRKSLLHRLWTGKYNLCQLLWTNPLFGFVKYRMTWTTCTFDNPLAYVPSCMNEWEQPVLGSANEELSAICHAVD